MADITGIVTIGDTHVPGEATLLLLNSTCSAILDETTSDPVTGEYVFTGASEGSIYYIFVWGEDIFRSRVLGPLQVGGDVIYDGSDFTGWTTVGSPTIDATKGEPPPSYKVGPGSAVYAYTESPIPLVTGVSIEWRVRLPSDVGDSDYLLDLVFGANGSGSGVQLRAEGRTDGSQCGISTRTSWGAANVPSIGMTGPISLDTWHTFRVEITDVDKCSWYLNGALVASNLTIAINGNFIGLCCVAGVTIAGGNVDNIQIFV